MKAKKSLGQHFLKSERALSTMVEAGGVNREDTILEIGPGTGALTEKLLAVGCKLLAVEKDDELYETLKIKFQKEIASGQLTLIHDDILNFNPRTYKLEPRTYKLVANIPYNITGAVLKKFLGTDCQPKKMVLLVQKEVAQRIVGQHGSRTSKLKESVLSISVKAYGVPRYMETVKAGSFVPMPSIDSAIIAVGDISKDFFIPPNTGGASFSEKDFFDMVHAGFKSKRKKLSSNLGTIFEKDMVLETFKKLGLDDNLRAEDVSIETWQKLAQAILRS